ncbi:Rhophilin, Rho GTPase binding protein [Ilyodon furcidens]|uniref:Rhophilin, Rho GTPase binding protein n=1 Tax=Ilyodon furcidens TaxID=33524 RepID=A0ABV0UXI3_9TELE
MREFSHLIQLASGAFSHIKDTVLSALNREPTMDICPETVGTLSTIMLAQAQEVFFLKATSDRMKDAVIAKLANQAADYYGEAFKQCQYKDNLPKVSNQNTHEVTWGYHDTAGGAFPVSRVFGVTKTYRRWTLYDVVLCARFFLNM